MKRWNTFYAEGLADSLEHVLNTLATNGWEVLQVLPSYDKSHRYIIVAYKTKAEANRDN